MSVSSLQSLINHELTGFLYIQRTALTELAVRYHALPFTPTMDLAPCTTELKYGVAPLKQVLQTIRYS